MGDGFYRSKDLPSRDCKAGVLVTSAKQNVGWDWEYRFLSGLYKPMRGTAVIPCSRISITRVLESAAEQQRITVSSNSFPTLDGHVTNCLFSASYNIYIHAWLLIWCPELQIDSQLMSYHPKNLLIDWLSYVRWTFEFWRQAASILVLRLWHSIAPCLLWQSPKKATRNCRYSETAIFSRFTYRRTDHIS